MLRIMSSQYFVTDDAFESTEALLDAEDNEGVCVSVDRRREDISAISYCRLVC